MILGLGYNPGDVITRVAVEESFSYQKPDE